MSKIQFVWHIIVSVLIILTKTATSFLLTHVCTIKNDISCSTTKLKSVSSALDLENIEDEQQKSKQHSEQQKAVGLYVHIPFCRKRCRYCNFAIVPIGSKVNTDDNVIIETNTNNNNNSINNNNGFQVMNEKYTKAIIKEINIIKMKYYSNKDNNDTKIPLKSIYFGGGTPSLAPIETLRYIMQTIMDHDNSPFEIIDDCEITIEMDPGTFTKEKLYEIKNLGFNRLSLGIQSFNNTILEYLGRIHRYNDIYKSIEMIYDVYGNNNINYSIDLISGLPGLSLSLWTDTLKTATNLNPRPTHLSIYDLQIESGTVFGSWYNNGEDDDDDDDLKGKQKVNLFHSTKGDSPISTKEILSLPTENEAAFMYKYTAGYLRAKGYEHYEVSSYALLLKQHDEKKSFRSQHNQMYWQYDGEWFAVGLGATSFVNKTIIARPRPLADYIEWVEHQQQQQIHDMNDVDEKREEEDDNNSSLDLLLDIVLKRLRTSEGLSLNWITSNYGIKTTESILRGAQLGIDLHLVQHDKVSNTLKLVDSTGFLYSNSIISSIFVELEK